MVGIFRNGLRLLRSTPAVVVPVVAFLILSEALRRPTAHFELSSDLIEQVIAFVSAPAVLGILGVTFSIKMLSVFFSNADMYLAYGVTRRRCRTIVASLGVRWFALMLLAAVAWTAAFGVIGLSVTALAQALLPKWLAFTTVAIIGAALFPVYYAGISMGSLITIASRVDNLRWDSLARTAWLGRWRIYRYYSVRSVLDSTIVIGVPVALALLVRSRALGISLTIIVVGLGISLVRASFMAFKRDVLLGPEHPRRPANGQGGGA